VKLCAGCKQEKPLSEFNRNASKKDGLQAYCKTCHRSALGQPYHRDKQKTLDSQRKRRKEKQEYIAAYLAAHPCIDCGETNPIVLEFDHRGDKVLAVSLFVQANRSLKQLVAEIEKCDVRCANCHRIKTARELGWGKWKTQPKAHSGISPK
jgi:hypothetical protein